MSERRIEPVDADMRPFVDAEREHPEPVPAQVLARLATGVRARLALEAAGGTRQAGVESPREGPGGPATGGAGPRWVRAHPIASVLLAALVGGGAGALLRPARVVTVAVPVDRIVYVDRPSPSAEGTNGPPPAKEATGTSPASPSTPPSNPAVWAADESQERLMLDAARQALLRGDPRASWEITEKHRHEFPRGALEEERDAVAVRALVTLGRGQEARSRAEALRKRFPKSVFLPAVETALGTLDAERADE